MSKVAHIDGRATLLNLLHEAQKRVEEGDTIAIAWVEVKADGCFRPGWWSTGACVLKSGDNIGGALMRAGVSTLAADMDIQTLEGFAETSNGGNPDTAV